MIINKDIAKAIKKEEEYLYHKVELLDNTANIYEYLAEAGYDDINEFRNDAQEYYLHSQNMTLENYVHKTLSVTGSGALSGVVNLQMTFL